MDSENVVVHGEHIERRGNVGEVLGLDGNLRVVDAREVAGTRGLVLLGLEREGVRVDTGHRGAGVVLEGLHLVEVLAGLLLEAVLAVENQLEGIDGASKLLSPGTTTGGATEDEGRTSLGGGHEHVATGDANVGCEHGGASREVPEVGLLHGAGIGAPDELLDGVVVGQTDLLAAIGGGELIDTGVLELLDEVLVTLLGEAAALLSVEVHVVAPDLEGGVVGVRGKFGGEVKVETDLVVLEGDEGEGQTGVAVEEEDEGEEHLGTDGAGTGGGHLTPRSLLGLIEVQLGVQPPPALVVLVDALTTDGQFDVLDGTLSGEKRVEGTAAGRVGETTLGLQLNVHVGDEITVASDSHGDASVVRGGTVDGLLDVLHREVSVAAVDRLEESNLGVTGQVNVLSAVSDELHETSSHCVCFVLYTEKKISPDGTRAKGSINPGGAKKTEDFFLCIL